jgi:hypothetical protein
MGKKFWGKKNFSRETELLPIIFVKKKITGNKKLLQVIFFPRRDYL